MSATAVERTALLADDAVAVCGACGEAPRVSGYHVVVVNGGHEALARPRPNVEPPRLILLDPVEKSCACSQALSSEGSARVTFS